MASTDSPAALQRVKDYYLYRYRRDTLPPLVADPTILDFSLPYFMRTRLPVSTCRSIPLATYDAQSKMRINIIPAHGRTLSESRVSISFVLESARAQRMFTNRLIIVVWIFHIIIGINIIVIFFIGISHLLMGSRISSTTATLRRVVIIGASPLFSHIGS
jgi:hypothetical protein